MIKVAETRQAPSPMEGAMELHKAMRFIGCDTAAVVSVLSHRNAAQRSLIRREYNTMYGRELIAHLKSKLGFNLRVKMAIVTWMLEGQEREAYVARKWMQEGYHGHSSNDRGIDRASDVICSRTQSEMPLFKQHYASINGASVEKHIKRYAISSSLRKLLTEHVSAPRREGVRLQPHEAEDDARLLYEAGPKRWFTDRDTFIKVFTRRSAAQIVAVSEAYARAYGQTLEKAIKKATSGNFRNALIVILNCAHHRISYFAEALNKAMKMRVTDVRTLTWVIVTRAEIDLHEIKLEYFKRYNKSLRQHVSSKTSGSYQTFLLHLIGPN